MSYKLPSIHRVMRSMINIAWVGSSASLGNPHQIGDSRKSNVIHKILVTSAHTLLLLLD